MAKAPIESRVTQTGAVGPVAAAIIGAVALFIAQFPIEPLRTACTPDTNQQDILDANKVNAYILKKNK